MPTDIELEKLQRLLAGGAQLVEVLPAEEYEELHLPGAVNIPLKQLDANSAQRLDSGRDIVVYCWDSLCDMSPRAAHRLLTLGFDRVHDYAASRSTGSRTGSPSREPTPTDLQPGAWSARTRRHAHWRPRPARWAARSPPPRMALPLCSAPLVCSSDGSGAQRSKASPSEIRSSRSSSLVRQQSDRI